MSSTIYGIGINQIVANPDFRAKKDATGKWTATQTYTIKRGDYASVAELFNKGELITGIYPEVQLFFAELIIEDHEYMEMPGGMDKVTVSFVGFQEGDEGQSERETVYEYNVDLADRPVIEHPKFKAFYAPNIETLVKYYEGLARVVGTQESGDPAFFDNYSSAELRYESSYDNSLNFFNKILAAGIKNYSDPVAEYTETKTDLGGLTDALLEDLAKTDTPPNNPPTPPGKMWFFSGASETRSSDNPITYTRKWMTLEDNEANNILYGD